MYVYNLYVQEYFNHGGSNSIQGDNRNSLDVINDPQSELEIC